MITRRRVVLALCAGTLAPLASFGQQSKVWRIGFLGDGVAASRAGETLDPFRSGLQELGYFPGRNIVLDVRWSDNNSERRAKVAQELVGLNPDVIVTHGSSAPIAIDAASKSVPVVIAVIADVMATGLVASLARPGGHVTGMTDQVADLSGKEVQLLKEMLPNLQRASILWDSSNSILTRMSQETQAAARTVGLQTHELPIQTPDEIETALEAALKARSGAVIVIHSPLTVGNRARIAQLALKKRLPLISAPVQFTEAGGLMSYGPDLTQYYRRAAGLVDKILKGAKPGDIPIEQPTRFEFMVNMKTARTLGIKIPQSILVQATKVIE